MFFQEIIPDTSGYMIAGFAVAFIVMALYVVSLYLRARNLRQDMTMLEELEEPAEPVRKGASPKPRNSPAKPAVNKTVKSVTKKS
ncbi:MAG: hypothetical protein ACM33V_08335 [Chloroflexota bacterium]|nr:hypothetical protein [Anaerolineales bacterium]